ncbi:MAG: S-layer homology domain-containing protein [Clostridiales bacterium]|nr:S-layer homology domain-containing protein [Clostridiales bacterium]
MIKDIDLWNTAEHPNGGPWEKEKKMKKRFFAILLAICLVLTMTPAVAMAAGGNSYVSVDEIRNLDGSVTTIETNKIKGTVTEETHFLNGTILTVVKESNGKVTSTERDAKDNITVTVENTDGTVEITQKLISGMYVQMNTSADGITTGRVTVPLSMHGSEEDVAILVPFEDGKLIRLALTNDAGRTELVKAKVVDGKVTLILLGSVDVKIMTLQSKTLPFTDVKEGDRYYDAVHYVYNESLMNGTGDGTVFSPNTKITRGMVVTTLWREAGEPSADEDPLKYFKDVDEKAWYKKSVTWASANDIVNGYTDKTFRPDTMVTREQLAAFLYRYEQSQGGGFSGAWMFNLKYTDKAKISDWAYEAVCWLTMNGIMDGENGKLDPQGQVSRGELADVLWKYAQASENRY